MTARRFPPTDAGKQAGLISRTVVVAALAVALCVVAAAPATAHKRAPVEVHTIGGITGPGTAAGTFTSSVGRIKDSGTYTETFTLAGAAISAVKFLTGRRGTVEMHMNAFLVFQTETIVAFNDGAWEFRNGTGAYKGLKGGGRPAVAAGSSDRATGIVDVVHRGTARIGRTDRNHGKHGKHRNHGKHGNQRNHGNHRSHHHHR